MFNSIYRFLNGIGMTLVTLNCCPANKVKYNMNKNKDYHFMNACIVMESRLRCSKECRFSVEIKYFLYRTLDISHTFRLNSLTRA